MKSSRGGWRGGSAVRQESVAAHLGLSRIPVRDAIAHLAASGLVSYEANRRVVVTVLKEKDLSELFEMRAVLEGLAARHAAPKLTQEDFDQLSWLATRMDQTETLENQWVPTHHEFHDLLCRRAGMPRLAREIARLRQAVEPYVRVLISLHGAAELGASRHNDLVDSIRNRNPDGAERTVREHIMEASRQIVATIRTSRLAEAPAAGGEVNPGRTARDSQRRTTQKGRARSQSAQMKENA